MTAPRPQWPLTPALRLAAISLLFALGSQLVEGWLSVVLWLACVVFLVLAAVQFAKHWKTRRTRL